MQNNNEKENAVDKVTDFIQKNRKGIFIVFAFLIFLFVGFVAYYFISDSLNNKAIEELDKLSERFSELHEDINQGIITDDIELLIEELKEFAQGRRGFTGSRAWSLVAQIYMDRNEWDISEEAWLKAATAGEKTYFGPIALFQVAAINEEQGKFEKAIEFYQKSVSHSFEFPAAPRAQFAIGRLNEELDNMPAALEAYRAILINWPDMPIWQHLARSRIIAIEVR
jgi:tetratricopeptide (TPR) repeat protein